MANLHSRYLNTHSFSSLDGLRALSILAVLWHHTAGEGAGWVLLQRGYLGVDLFFEISGFLIITLLLRERRASGTISLGGFYMRRALRILPAYWALLGIVALMVWLKPGATSAELNHDLPFAFFYLSNLVPMGSLLSISWSLSAEEQFYLIVPALEKFLARAFPILVLPALYLCVILPPFGLFAGWHLPGFFRETTFAPILLGVMLAHVLNEPRGWAFVNRWLGGPFMPLITLALVVAACCYPGASITGWPRLVIHLCLLLLLASCVVREEHALRGLLTWAPVRRVGVVSYGMYLYHMLVYWPVARLLERTGLHSGVVFFLVLAAATWGVAEVSYRFFERPFLALKKRYSAAAPRLARQPA